MADGMDQQLQSPLSDSSSFPIERIEAFAHRVSDRTEFLFVRLATTGGELGWGEATFNNLNGQVVVALRMLAEFLESHPLKEARQYLASIPAWRHGRAYQIAISALEQAIADIEAKRFDLPFGCLFGPIRRDHVDCYANINRGTTDRSPAGWARRAEGAVSQGFSALKIAPFDQVAAGDASIRSAGLANGIEAISATREAVGAKIDLMLDCHWRFDPEFAPSLIDQVSGFDLAWLEAPIPEDFLAIEDLCAIRRIANESGIMLAGGEYLDGPRAITPFLRSGAYDVVNPDVRLCGARGSFDVANQADAQGIGYAPHNHLGPVMTAVNLHIASVAPRALTLELQFEEADSNLVDPAVFAPSNGRLMVPDGPGLGIDIDMDALNSVALR